MTSAEGDFLDSRFKLSVEHKVLPRASFIWVHGSKPVMLFLVVVET